MRWKNHPWSRHVAWMVTVIFFALVQTNWPDALKLQEVVPDFVLIMVVYYAIAEGEERAMFTGLLGGLYQDVAVHTVLGHHVICHVIVGYTVGRVSTRLITEHAAIKAGLVLLASLGQGILFLCIQYVQQPQRGMLYPLLTAVVPCAFYTAVVAPVILLSLDMVMGRREPIGRGVS